MWAYSDKVPRVVSLMETESRRVATRAGVVVGARS